MNRANVELGCLFIGEYVDEADVPTDRHYAQGEVVRPHLIAEYSDTWAKETEEKEFTVLLRDKSIITVQGQSVRHLQNASNPQDYGSYAILTQSGNREITVAIFRVSEVTGIFNGACRLAQNAS